jgi:serine/threonine protein kinase
MQKDLMDYLKYTVNKDSLFYSQPNEKLTSKNPFKIPNYDSQKWSRFSDEHWTYLMFKEKDFPDQGWKIHLTADMQEAANLLYDVAEYLISKEISFKYVPNLVALGNKNVKYANRTGSGKFITVYPDNNDVFFNLLNDLKELTQSYKIGPYILNDQQWQESNVFFRYGGLKRITTEVDGREVLAIRRPDGTLIPDERLPYYHLPDFVEEPDFIVRHNTFPSEELFKRLNDFEIIDVLHHSNAGGVYLAESEGKKLILKEGRQKAGIDGNGKDGFQRNRNEYFNLKRLKNVEGVINAHGYFTAWHHNYLIEDYHEGRNLQTFISQEYPFVKSSNKNSEYAGKCILIIKQLMSIIEGIHKKGIAMGDLSLTNVMLSDSDLKITLIDFEAATSTGNSFVPTIATPGFISSEAKNFMEADWFAIYRISRTLFLPVGPVNDIAPQITTIHDKLIGEKFGEEVIIFLKEIENKVSKHTNLRPHSPFLNQSLSTPSQELSLDNIDYFIKGLQKGIINNLDLDSISLIKGNIDKYRESTSNHNIAHGSFGVILSLIRSGDKDYIEGLKFHIGEWLKLILPFIEKESRNHSVNQGLLNGYSGIVTVLYELGYEKSAQLVLENLVENLTEDKINSMDDISVHSGLSGIGLLYLSFYNIFKDPKILKTIKSIYNRIILIYRNTEESKDSFSDFGLLTGWSGAALFLFKVSSVLEDNNGKNIAFELVDKSFETVLEEEYDDGLFIIDNSRGFNRLIPYLETGSSGIALTMLEFQKEDKSYLNATRKKILENFIDSNYLFCSANGGLMNGYVGFLPLANGLNHLYGKEDMVRFLLKNMNNYFVSNNDDEILFPGDYGFKCSMDVSTGAAGVLLTLSDLSKNAWGSWLPIPQNSFNLFKQ